LTPDDLLHRLERHTVLPSVGARDLPGRQRTMNATVAWSYQLLNADEQRAFRRLGVLPGLFPIDAAAAVLAGRNATTDEGEALRAVASLIDKSLLVRAQPSVIPTCQSDAAALPGAAGRSPCTDETRRSRAPSG
jgi:predicted ATPase